MKLAVPVLRQEGALDCGIACLSMLLRYYRVDEDVSQPASALRIYEGVGTYMPQLGKFLLDNGFRAEMVTMNPYLCNVPLKQATPAELMQHLQDFHDRTRDPRHKASARQFLEFMAGGGELAIRIPSPADIRREISLGRPLLALLTSAFLTSGRPGFNFHFNVITGIDDRLVYVNDPRSDSWGGERAYPIADFFFALFASAHGDLDNASLLCIEQK